MINRRSSSLQGNKSNKFYSAAWWIGVVGTDSVKSVGAVKTAANDAGFNVNDMINELTRRKMLMTSGGIAMGGMTAAGLVGSDTQVADSVVDCSSDDPQITYCLNTSTIRGQEIGLEKEVELAAKVGYQGIEPWIGEITDYQKNGGSLKDLKKKIADLGLVVESAIGFANWIVDDPQKRKAGLEQAKVDMDLVSQIGGTHIAAPPAGATKQADLNLFEAAKRFRDLHQVGESIGVIPQVEVWGFSKSLSRLGECLFVAVESGCENACVLPDVYHIYKGGSDFQGLSLLSGQSIQCFHMNDYPADPPREKINDAARVYPGDGVAPITEILRTVLANGFQGALSLELFNRDYWKQDPEVVLRTGLEKMKKVVAKSVSV